LALVAQKQPWRRQAVGCDVFFAFNTSSQCARLTTSRRAAIHAALHGDAAGFRAYISPAREAGALAGLKRKAPDGGAGQEPPAARAASLGLSGRTASGALRGDGLEVRGPRGL